MVHFDRHPGSMFDLTAWYDTYECDGCGEPFEVTVTLPDLPWGEVRTRAEVDGERYTGAMNGGHVTVIYQGIRHPNFPDHVRGEGDEDERDLDPDHYPTPEEDALDYLDDGPEGDVDPIAEPPDDHYDERRDEDELRPPSRVPVLDHDPQPTAPEWAAPDRAPSAW
ncbi:hypothetical protein ACFVZH_37380 [Streptomyces sp. NPDC059534]|uniref:hypothetical protein n=1 Tax=Streptomyces sp. NPDC059534 TaxID=3346859 RepID=UPI0036AC521F